MIVMLSAFRFSGSAMAFFTISAFSSVVFCNPFTKSRVRLRPPKGSVVKYTRVPALKIDTVVVSAPISTSMHPSIRSSSVRMLSAIASEVTISFFTL